MTCRGWANRQAAAASVKADQASDPAKFQDFEILSHRRLVGPLTDDASAWQLALSMVGHQSSPGTAWDL